MTKEDLISVQSFETEEQYRSSASLNYSLIKNLVDGPKALIEDKDLGSSVALNVGNFVDTYFTNRENLNNIYGTERKIELPGNWEEVYNNLVLAEEWEPTPERIIEVCRTLGLYPKMGDEAVKGRIPTLMQDKLSYAKEKVGKILLTEKEHSQTMCSIENIERSETSMALITEHEGEIVIPQFKVEFQLMMDSGHDRTFRVMIDILKVNLNTNEIYGIDIKTGRRYSHEFYDQFIEYRYDIQGILYYWGLLAIRRVIRERFGIELNSPPPENFKFVYSPKMQNKKPIIISLDERWIKLHGNQSLDHKGISYPGCWKLMNDADWYLTNQEFSDHRLIATRETYTLTELSNAII